MLRLFGRTWQATDRKVTGGTRARHTKKSDIEHAPTGAPVIFRVEGDG
jgi:hypothetical protein